MSSGDYIQLAMLLVVLVSVVALVFQTVIQNRLLKAQLLKDRFEMYWRTYEPVTETHVEDFKLFPDDYMDRGRFEESYVGNDAAIKRYIYMSVLYEYLAFTHTLGQLGVPDPLGADWSKKWASELVRVKEFQDAHEEYRGYYPSFEESVDELTTQARGA